MTPPTAGPWEVVLRAHESPLILGGTERIDGVLQTTVAEVYPEGADDAGAETLANAHLIAAAPDLLAALEAVCAYYVDINAPFRDPEERKAVELADAAIAKAKAGAGAVPARLSFHNLSVPRPAVDGGSDSDNLAVIAHNLGCIATRLNEFFDCGASMAGRGI